MKRGLPIQCALCIFCSVCLIGVTGGVSAQVLTLRDCLDLATRNNPSLKASEYQLASAKQDIKVAGADFYPQISASSSYNYIDNLDTSGTNDSDSVTQQKLDASFNVSQTLYAGRRVINTYERAKERSLMVAADRNHFASELKYRVKVRFFELMKAKEDVSVAADTVKRLEADAAMANAFYEKELAPYAQVLQARVDLSDAKQRLSIAENTVDRKRASLFELIHESFSPDVTFTGGLAYYRHSLDMTAEACMAQAVKQRFDLLSLLHQRNMMEKDAAVAMSNYKPKVQLNAGLYDQDRDYDLPSISDQHNTYWSAGVNVSWNLFDGGRGRHEREKYHIEMKRIDELYQQIESELATGVRTALFSVSEAKERIQTATDEVAAADEYYERENKRFQAGIATISSVLDAQVRVTRAKGSHVQALLDYQLARAELDFIVGETEEKVVGETEENGD